MKKPNLLFIFADQWRREAVGFMKKEPVITPNFDAFSNKAAIFEKAYSSCPLCSPNRAAILTGKNPISHGVITNCKPGPKRHGFDFWYSYGADDNHLSPHYWMDSPEMININKWSVEHETDIALDFIDKNKDDSFALFLSWNPPHTPLDLIPQKYVDMYKGVKVEKRENVILKDIVDHPKTITPFSLDEAGYLESVKKYYAAITGIDEHFGKIIDYLKRIKS